MYICIYVNMNAYKNMTIEYIHTYTSSKIMHIRRANMYVRRSNMCIRQPIEKQICIDVSRRTCQV